MKNIEVLKDRIAKRQDKVQRLTANIEKLQKKIEKIAATQPDERERDWEIRCVQDEIEDKKYKIDTVMKEIEKYSAEIVEVEAWQNKNRDVKAIWEFLEGWKEHERRFMANLYKVYDEKKSEISKLKSKASALEEEITGQLTFKNWRERWDWEGVACNNEKTLPLLREYRRMMKEVEGFKRATSPLMPYLTLTKGLDTEKLNKDLNADAVAMYDRLLAQIEKITGEIIDATYLRIGEKGEINGYIIGKDGRASVQTIGAGGYNIQRYHFRTLVHEYK